MCVCKVYSGCTNCSHMCIDIHVLEFDSFVICVMYLCCYCCLILYVQESAVHVQACLIEA